MSLAKGKLFLVSRDCYPRKRDESFPIQILLELKGFIRRSPLTVSFLGRSQGAILVIISDPRIFFFAAVHVFLRVLRMSLISARTSISRFVKVPSFGGRAFLGYLSAIAEGMTAWMNSDAFGNFWWVGGGIFRRIHHKCCITVWQ